MDWSFLDHLPNGRYLGVGLTIIAGAFALGAAFFKWLANRRTDYIIQGHERQLAQDKREWDEKKKALEALEIEYNKRVDAIANREATLSTLRSGILGSTEELWRLHRPQKPIGYEDAIAARTPPVIMVANLKGGVAKTTLSANLAAHFARRSTKRVLLVDLDNQASLSNMMLSSIGDTTVRSDVSRLLNPSFDNKQLPDLITPLDREVPKLDLISSSKQLAPTESSLLLSYVLQESGPDTRYLLARALQSDYVRERYSLVILDCPPHLSPSAINGLCACSHILVPTILDRLSAEAVGFFLGVARRLTIILNPSVQVLGMVGVRTARRELKTDEKNSRNIAMKQLADSWPLSGAELFQRNIPTKAAIQAAAGGAVVYNRDATVRAWFDELGDQISARLGWAVPLRTYDEGKAAARTVGRTQEARPIPPASIPS